MPARRGRHTRGPRAMATHRGERWTGFAERGRRHRPRSMVSRATPSRLGGASGESSIYKRRGCGVVVFVGGSASTLGRRPAMPASLGGCHDSGIGTTDALYNHHERPVSTVLRVNEAAPTVPASTRPGGSSWTPGATTTSAPRSRASSTPCAGSSSTRLNPRRQSRSERGASDHRPHDGAIVTAGCIGGHGSPTVQRGSGRYRERARQF